MFGFSFPLSWLSHWTISPIYICLNCSEINLQTLHPFILQMVLNVIYMLITPAFMASLQTFLSSRTLHRAAKSDSSTRYFIHVSACSKCMLLNTIASPHLCCFQSVSCGFVFLDSQTRHLTHQGSFVSLTFHVFSFLKSC